LASNSLSPFIKSTAPTRPAVWESEFKTIANRCKLFRQVMGHVEKTNWERGKGGKAGIQRQEGEFVIR
jgi:hypothetical protein